VLELLPGSQWRERYPWYHRGFPARR
jgi:hypothetical protein